MSRIKSTDPTAAAAAPLARAAAPRPVEAKSVGFDSDFFKRNAPSPEAVQAAEKAVAAASKLPFVPLSNKAKAGWLKEARATVEAAEKGMDVLRDAEWAKAYPEAKLDAAREIVGKAHEKIYGVEVRAGNKPLPWPPNPFRPLFQFTNNFGSHVPGNVLGGLVAIIALPVAIAVDIADMITRPLQAVWWPVGMIWNGARKGAQMIGLG